MIARGPPTNSWAAGLARQAPIPHLRLSPHLRRLLRSRPFRRPRLRPHPFRRPRPLPAPQATRPRRRHFSLRQRGANRPTAPLCTVPSSCPFLRHASLRSQGPMSPLPIRLPTIPGLQPIWMRPLPACRRSTFQLTRFLPPTRAPRTMRAVRHIPISLMAMLAPIASRPRIMAPHRAIISTIRTLPRLHRNMTRRPRPRRRIPKARAKSASPIITPRKRRCVSRNFRRQSRLPLSPLSLPCSASLRLRDSSCSAAPPRPNRQRSKKRTTISTWTSTPSRATPTTGTSSGG